MRYPVTIDAVERVLSALGHEWRGEWQREIAKALCEAEEVVIQGPRQVTGKTFTVGMYEGTRIISGRTVTVGYPTLSQTTRLLGENIAKNVNQFNNLYQDATGKPMFRRPKDQVTYMKWQMLDDPTHIGKLYSLSANEISKHVPEGYTTDDLNLDEAHRQTVKTLGTFEPFTDIASQRGDATIAYMGVGGHKLSLIEIKKQQPGVKVIRYTADDIAQMDPRWIPVFQKRKESLSSWQWRIHYMCEKLSEGMKFMYPELPGAIDIQPELVRNIMPTLYFGVDVGKVVDSTVVKVISVVQGIRNNEAVEIVNEVDSFEISGCSYTDQAQAIYKWIDGRFYWKANRIVVELNGVGQAFYDILCEIFGKSLRGIHTTADLKEQFWHESSMAVREGRFGVKDQLARAQYEALMYNVRESDGKLEFEHSDYWMALCMAWVGKQTVGVL